MAASTAVPPRWRTRRPAPVARGWGDATRPRGAMTLRRSHILASTLKVLIAPSVEELAGNLLRGDQACGQDTGVKHRAQHLVSSRGARGRPDLRYPPAPGRFGWGRAGTACVRGTSQGFLEDHVFLPPGTGGGDLHRPEEVGIDGHSCLRPHGALLILTDFLVTMAPPPLAPPIRTRSTLWRWERQPRPFLDVKHPPSLIGKGLDRLCGPALHRHGHARRRDILWEEIRHSDPGLRGEQGHHRVLSSIRESLAVPSPLQLPVHL